MKIIRKSMLLGCLMGVLGLSMFSGCTKEEIRESETEEIIIDHSVDDAPKTIESHDLITFICEFTTEKIDGKIKVPAGTYQLEARLESTHDGDIVKGIYRFGDFDDMEGVGAVFEASPAFMEKLQMIVAKNDLAKENGRHLITEGQPEDSGASYYLEYADGEYVSAGDNAENFITTDTMAELYELFYVESGVQMAEENELESQKPLKDTIINTIRKDETEDEEESR